MSSMKEVLVNTSSRIGTRVYDVTMSNDQPSLRGWISEIECFEVQMRPYLDKKYFNKKKEILKYLKVKEKDEEEDNGKKFKCWLNVYGLLCQKMQMYGAYPLTPREESMEHDHPEYIFEEDEEEEKEGELVD